ncbi:YpmS family protein [Bacillus sp. REN3]|uniref:YpmS family protein n=1 Tax=Bacillus sp. REN3 TaxID=2802440 RepID=UPI001AEEDC43|nr:YpmS family protein [Bacillus sp. REN3]
MKNYWKVGFFILLGLVAAGIIGIFVLAAAPVDDSKLQKSKKASIADDVAFEVKTNKRDLNRVINHYLEEEAKGSNMDYDVLLTDEVELYGTMPFFSDELELKLAFEPEALENGDMVLKQRSISVGRLRLPVSTVLKFVQKGYNLPDAVNIQPEEELVYITMDNLKLKSDIKVRVNQVDLKKDNIRFTIYAPAD